MGGITPATMPILYTGARAHASKIYLQSLKTECIVPTMSSPALDDDQDPPAPSGLSLVPTPEEAYETLEALSRLRRKNLVIPKTQRFSRAEVVNSFVTAFEVIGGTTRLALWANENTTEFYRLFGKLIPSSSIAEIMHHKDPTDPRQLTTAELEELVRQRLTSEKVVPISDYQYSESIDTDE